MLSKILGAFIQHPQWNFQSGSGTNSNVAKTVTAGNRRVLIHHVAWSYSTAPTGGRLTISDGINNTFDVDITASGPGGFGVSWLATKETNVVVTLYAGGASVVGKLNVSATLEAE